jgi:hypothetical protein
VGEGIAPGKREKWRWVWFWIIASLLAENGLRGVWPKTNLFVSAQNHNKFILARDTQSCPAREF